jgi:hypothetical protein
MWADLEEARDDAALCCYMGNMIFEGARERGPE